MSSIDGEIVSVFRGMFESLFPHLDERQRRLAAGAAARALGHGGMTAVVQASGLAQATVSDGVWELEAGSAPLGRARRPGGGRKNLTETDPGLVPALLALVEPGRRGDPMSALSWTTRSTRDLARTLTGDGHPVSAPKVGELLREQGFSLQGNAKTLEGAQHPDRDAQFRYINTQVSEHQADGEPVISVDAKKKEIIGQFKNAGRTWRPRGRPVQVDTHDFPDAELGKAAPYGVYDLTANTGWVNVGTDHDTAAFAIESIRRWWNAQGRLDYPDATRLLITADAGGSNGYRTRAFKTGLADLADHTGLQVTVCHFPPGTSKWNKVEHRLFSAITMNWRGRPLTSHEIVVQTIAATTTGTGLTVRAELDPGAYPTGVKISDDQMDTVPVIGHQFHGEWNYTVHPRPTTGTHPPAVFDWAVLADPALTGTPGEELHALAAALDTAHQAEQAATGRTRTGPPPKLTHAHRVTALLLQQRLALPTTTLARLLGVNRKRLTQALTDTRRLLDQHGHTPPAQAAHLITLTGFTLYAATHGIHPTTQINTAC